MLRPLAAGVLALVVGSPVRADFDDGSQSSIVRVGDVDGDGRDDLLVASRDDPPQVVWLLSGASGSVLHEFTGKLAGDGFGCTMARAGDANRDGVADFWIAAKGTAGGPCVDLYSGKDTHLLRRIEPRSPAPCGRVSLHAGDLDGDLVPDLLAGFVSKRGCVRAWAGADGNELFALSSDMSTDRGEDAFGASVAILGDLDHDGHVEFAVGDPKGRRPVSEGDRRPAGGEGCVRIYSLTSSGPQLLRTRYGDRIHDLFGSVLLPFPDQNKDGMNDLLIAAESRSVRVLSGKDLSVLVHVDSRCFHAWYDAFGSSLDVFGDHDSDGVPDFLVAANESFPAFDEGYAEIRSGKDGGPLRVLFESKTEGVDAASAGRIDDDEVDDIALVIWRPKPPTYSPPKVYLPDPPVRSGWLRLLSGKDGSLIREVDLAALRQAEAGSRRTK